MSDKKKKEPALIIFIKNPEIGEVKTRLARDIGEKQAHAVYKFLLNHTMEISRHLSCKKFLFYSSRIEAGDMWDDSEYEKMVQHGEDLGERMENAFSIVLDCYKPAIIIGSDCLELTRGIIKRAFLEISRKNTDIVIGPARDGGYYLLGMKSLHVDLFRGKSWSMPVLLEETLNTIKKLCLRPVHLETLSDIDTMEDIKGTVLESLAKRPARWKI